MKLRSAALKEQRLARARQETLTHLHRLETRDDEGFRQYEWFREWVEDLGVEQFYAAKDDAARHTAAIRDYPEPQVRIGII